MATQGSAERGPFGRRPGGALPDCRRLPGTGNRRNSPRIRRAVPIRYRSGALLFRDSYALSVGATGARIVTHRPVEPSRTVHVVLALEPDWQVQVVGTPVWQQPIAGGRRYVVGLAFRTLLEEDQDRLHRWIRTAAEAG